MLWNKNDMLQLVMDKAIPKGESTTVITQRVLLLNFAAINTTMSVSERLPFYAYPLRPLLQLD